NAVISTEAQRSGETPVFAVALAFLSVIPSGNLLLSLLLLFRLSSRPRAKPKGRNPLSPVLAFALPV
ncbi:MAG: hypothetical protein ABR971_14855, partial [Acidobacteriaceae bacterium]